MDWRLFFTAFWAVFVAELADKTQLVGLGLAAKSGKPLSVFLGSCSAYLIITCLTVMFGAAFAKFISPEIIRYFGAFLFIAIGVLILFRLV